MRHPRHHDRKARHDQVVLDALGLILKTVHQMSIDTTKMLAAVALERSENASLRALLIAHVGVETDLSKKLADALAQIQPAPPPTDDVAALKQQLADAQASNKALADAATSVQADLDQASSDLAADNQATADAISANQLPAAQQAPTPQVDPALPAVAQANLRQPSTDPAAAQQLQPAAVPFTVSNDDNPAKDVNVTAVPGAAEIAKMNTDDLRAEMQRRGGQPAGMSDADMRTALTSGNMPPVVRPDGQIVPPANTPPEDQRQNRVPSDPPVTTTIQAGQRDPGTPPFPGGGPLSPDATVQAKNPDGNIAGAGQPVSPDATKVSAPPPDAEPINPA